MMTTEPENYLVQIGDIDGATVAFETLEGAVNWCQTTASGIASEHVLRVYGARRPVRAGDTPERADELRYTHTAK